MRLSTRAQYAVRAMVDLALYSTSKPVSLKEIAQREEIPLSYLEQLFFRLKNGGIVTSIRGPGGGYILARESSLIKVGEIVVTVEEPLSPVACMDEGSTGCSRISQCVTHNIWKGLGEKIRGFLDGITLEDLAQEARRNLEA
ncbi:helix-turn-helix iron-sulfur cluster-binding transcriptional regulator IscR [Geotalea daltonii FRC-32]|uniref:Helix-turn-helix iron-sulfur cluster-binding transcriptional regulator IscR n=1 Tax=Geotalea daltonii (strain DSM 22248 / JCM 15807 / FRC-32) TaxID=316067 RepID=B9M872_GEODF|nr:MULTISPECIES: Rrf2 family transcriptional regulator [Geotalea]ACM20338.1 helix-turn-helix iron-sulfur cluster-binding transcriptional regulator IscR [Geotalea daltonii FRC-32]